MDAAQGLEYLASAGVVHGDVKARAGRAGWGRRGGSPSSARGASSPAGRVPPNCVGWRAAFMGNDSGRWNGSQAWTELARGGCGSPPACVQLAYEQTGSAASYRPNARHRALLLPTPSPQAANVLISTGCGTKRGWQVGSPRFFFSRAPLTEPHALSAPHPPASTFPLAMVDQGGDPTLILPCRPK